ncbi:MAG: ABC transporter substrate-binding protein [Bacteroidales bacterium]|nr:ABC transporter substrate-binding protein [Bacteroidales bacterium]
MLRKSLITVLLLCLALTAWAQKIVFSPQWTAQAQFAGYYAALQLGYYKEAGLDVEIRHPSASSSCWNKLKSGESQAVTMQLFSAMPLMESEGLPLVNILQTSQQNCLMIISRKPLEHGIKSLSGLRVGRWKAGFGELIDILDRKEGLDIDWIYFIQNISLFISGAIDATMAMSYNEYCQLLMSGQQFVPEQLVYFSKIGYDIPEDAIYVRRDWYKAHKDEAHRFAEASRRGWEWCAENPEAALDIVMQQTAANKIHTSRVLQKFMLQEILDKQLDAETGERSFRLDPADVDFCNKLLLEYGYIKNRISYQQLTGNED